MAMCKVSSVSTEIDPLLKEHGLERRLILTFDDGAVIEYCGSSHMDQVIKPVKLVNIDNIKYEDPSNNTDSFYASIDGTPDKEGIEQTVFHAPSCYNTNPKKLADYLQSAHEYAKELMGAFRSGHPSPDLGIKVNQESWRSTYMLVWHAIRTQGPSEEYIAGLRSK